MYAMEAMCLMDAMYDKHAKIYKISNVGYVGNVAHQCTVSLDKIQRSS